MCCKHTIQEELTMKPMTNRIKQEISLPVNDVNPKFPIQSILHNSSKSPLLMQTSKINQNIDLLSSPPWRTMRNRQVPLDLDIHDSFLDSPCQEVEA